MQIILIKYKAKSINRSIKKSIIYEKKSLYSVYEITNLIQSKIRVNLMIDFCTKYMRAQDRSAWRTFEYKNEVSFQFGMTFMVTKLDDVTSLH